MSKRRFAAFFLDLATNAFQPDIVDVERYDVAALRRGDFRDGFTDTRCGPDDRNNFAIQTKHAHLQEDTFYTA